MDPSTGSRWLVLAALSGACASHPSAGTGGGAGGTAGAGATGPDAASGSDCGGAGETRRTDPASAGDGDFTIAPPYQAAPELTVAAGVPRGQLSMFTLSSSGSAIYPSDVATGVAFTRSIWVYVPAQYVAGTTAPFMVVQDGGLFTTWIPPTLDTMIDEGRLPVTIAILINPGPGDGIGSERGLEYDTVSDAYVTFIETEILPAVQTRYGVTLTTDPEGRSAVGLSSGGAAAFTMGWFRPDLYHRILTYSGSFVALGVTAAYPHGAWEYHEHLIAENGAKPLRVFLEAAQNDDTVANVTHGLDPALSGFYDWLQANIDMAAALEAKCYHTRYVYAADAGHANGAVITQTLPDELVWLWQGYPMP